MKFSLRAVTFGLAAVTLYLGATVAGGYSPSTAPASVDRDIPIVVLAGAPSGIGRQHGTQLGDQIRFLDEKYLGHLLGTDQQKFMARMAATPFSSKMDPRHLQ